MKYIESNKPEGTRIQVVYLYDGRCSRNRMKRVAHTPTKYVTIAKLIDTESNSVLSTGVSACSKKDKPSRKVGRAIAVGRALAGYEHSRWLQSKEELFV